MNLREIMAHGDAALTQKSAAPMFTPLRGTPSPVPVYDQSQIKEPHDGCVVLLKSREPQR